MNSEWKITYFKPDRAEIFFKENEIIIAAEILSKEECGVILYDHKDKEYRIPFSEEGRRGFLYGMKIEGEGISNFRYNFYRDEEVFTDPYATKICGLEKWGASKETKRKTFGCFSFEKFDWQGDVSPMIPLEDSIFYGLNVRSFTMHKSSKVKNKGTFEGIVEKIPYLKELGITAIELMPCYEYEECLVPERVVPDFQVPVTAAAHETVIKMQLPDRQVRLNCWGFQNAFYFAPKASYSASHMPEVSFKTMVRELHKNGIEVIMQFYFPPEIRQCYMLDAIKFWVTEYHIDGVRISGFHIPHRLLGEEPALKDTKIWCNYFPEEDMSVISNPVYKNFISNNGNYLNDMRRFLKGDEGLIEQMLYYQRRNPKEYSVVNYMADYDGFSLYDSVSYERKHNEKNGEDNRDGNDINFTWNCGMEGDSRKNAVQELRLKQIKNIMSFLFLSQGIPFIFSGDEFGNTRNGNNNCYCQDNATGWIKWKDSNFAKEILEYTRFLIRLRKNHPILHMKEEFRVMDVKGCGYPDISYHGIEAWRPDLSYMSRTVGIMLCGQYAPKEQDTSFYIAFNMHWDAHRLALPKLPKDEIWVRVSDTSEAVASFSEAEGANDQNQKNQMALVKGRSIAVYQTRKCTVKASHHKRKAQQKNKREDD